MDNKSVVISKSWGELLTPYWFTKYMEKKGINIYCYELKLIEKEEDEFVYQFVKDTSKFNDKEEYYSEVAYLTENLGEFISESNYDKLYELDNSPITYIFDETNNREDKDLIEIAKEIDDNNYIKIIEIPSDVKYKVRDNECGGGEYIEEEHSVWY